jgi:hypothetical protein
MIPQFVRDKHSDERHSKSLVIVFDQFSDDIALNKDMLDSIVDKKPIDLWIISTTINKKIVTDILFHLTNQMDQFGIKPEQCIICNYICFANPNNMELIIEENSPPIMQKCLDKFSGGKYAYCFYQWFGYNVYTYNLIYNYKNYILFRRNSHFIILNKLCSNIPIHTHISSDNFSMLALEVELENSKAALSVLNELCKHCLDITSYGIGSGSIPYKLDYKYKIRQSTTFSL